MGYTHYWQLRPGGSPVSWSRALMRVGEIIRNAPCALAGPLGDGQPVMDDERVAFNGKGRYACETFSMSVVIDEPSRDFCKTARYPYDVVVTACLAVLETYAADIITVTSDGCPQDWVKGVQLARRITGENAIDIPAGVYSTLDVNLIHEVTHLQEGQRARRALARRKR